jgi:CheY-like chemotaxis protein/phosphoribosyl 1,2-cyclic phosphodiesterase
VKEYLEAAKHEFANHSLMRRGVMRIRFWGTRGSLAKPGPTTVRYGGNTSCVEVRTADDTLIVLDCGTGAHGLGLALAAGDSRPVRGHLLIGHTHWDHIQGFPFFAPLFVPGNVWDIYAPGGLGKRLEETLAGQMEYAYFPVTLNQLGATIHYHELLEGTFDLQGVQVAARYLNHPAVTLGYRLKAGNAVMVYATDHEPHARPQFETSSQSGAGPNVPLVHREDQQHIEFLRGADLIIHDAQYTAAEYPQKVGWGHSPMEYTVDVALAAGAKRLALFHHDPSHDDAMLDRLVEACRQRVAACHGALEVFAAAEGQVIELSEQEGAVVRGRGSGMSTAVDEPGGAAVEREIILIVDDEPDIVEVLRATLAPERYRLLLAYDGDTALQMARARRPSLILLDWRMPGRDGLEVCRALRADADPHLRHVPVVLLTAQMGEENITAGFTAGVTDYLTKPFTPAHVRSRVRSWLLRSRPDASDDPARNDVPS